MADKKVGIYFGRKGITVVETKGKAIIKQAKLPLGAGESSADTLIASEERLRVAFQQFISDNRINARKAFVGLLDKDQFIRSFPMMLLTGPEIDMGAQFESRKYIPFRPEDLVFDYQYYIDKKASRIDVLYVAALKSNFENIFNALNQAGLEVSAVEPASLALLRVLSLPKQLELKASFLLVVMDDSDAEFTIELTVVSNGFPYLSREMKLSYLPDAEASGDKNANLRTRLASEIRVSLDYYRRQFSGRVVDKVLFLSKTLLKQEEFIPGLSRDLGLPVERVELESRKELEGLDSLDALRAYSLTLKNEVKSWLTIDLLKRRQLQQAAEKQPQGKKFNIGAFKAQLALALALVLAAFQIPQAEIKNNKSRLSRLRMDTDAILDSANLKGMPLEALSRKKTDFSSKINILEKLSGLKINVTPSWNFLPRALSGGLWIEYISISIKEGKAELRLKGFVYLGDQNTEISAVRNFHQKLKESPDFMAGFSDLKLTSVGQAAVEQYGCTGFEIIGN